MRTSVLAIAAAGLATACLADRDPLSPDMPDCVRPPVDTTGWARVPDETSPPSVVSLLVPPTFTQLSSRRWERGATAIGWQTTGGGPRTLQPFPEMTHTGSCRAYISDRRVVFDYGTIVSGGPNPDAVIVARWPDVGLAGHVLIDARMRDMVDRPILESMLWSVQVRGGR